MELLPVFQFDPSEYGGTNPLTGAPLSNYWGYSTVGFFAPHSGYCVRAAEAQHVAEFRDMVKALHRAGIEVILDVVFNHTSEGNHQGPTMHFSRPRKRRPTTTSRPRIASITWTTPARATP